MSAYYFSSQTRKQIEIGEDITENLKQELGDEKPIAGLIQVINQCLTRDPYWKQYYEETMDSLSNDTSSHSFIDLFIKEFQAEQFLAKCDYCRAEQIYQEIANSISYSDLDKGWYLQLVAKCAYFRSKIDSNLIQNRAHDYNAYLFMPLDVHYKAVGNTNQTSLQLVINYLAKFKNKDDFFLKINETLSDLSFGVLSNKFEAALKEIGLLLGFISERPDLRYKKGPDNLWVSPKDRNFFVFECKNEVNSTRQFISKEEVGQMNNHIGWFEEEYKDCPNVAYIHIHQTNIISVSVHFSPRLPEK